MSWNGSGTFNRIYSWVADKAAGLNISSTRMDTDTDDIASNGFGNCLTRDGQGQPTANLPMAGFRHTGVANAVNRSDYASLSQAQDGLIEWTTAGGTADALTATYTPTRGAPVDGALYFVRAGNANATTTPTFAPDSQTARTITKLGGTALVKGDIPGNLAELILRYNSANTRYELLNPAIASASTRTRTILGGGTSGTYTTPSGARVIFVRAIAGGGGGGGSGTTAGTGTAGGTGGNTTFGTTFLSCVGGGGGGPAGGNAGGAGTASGGDAGVPAVASGAAGGGNGVTSPVGSFGGAGGNSIFGGGGFGGQASATNGQSAPNNTGAGGGGGGGPTGAGYGGGGGGVGGYVEKLIQSPLATYSYSVGSGGSAGSAGAGGAAGGVGGGGLIIIDEYY